ncbi:putative C-type lectin domain family 20 member A [Misgurnus anguillicaudatus]|uniref:putative C-type lectin domain family 20 member A n=1 Tax=Misgurnus anguillicaudatus TaxID=75329 RepID=UPI003CCF55E2
MKIVVFALLLSAHCELTTALKRKHIYFGNAMTWTKAQSYCRTYYVDLSSADSQEEITALRGIGSYSWVGLRQISANNWQWSDGGNSSFITWAAGEPTETSTDICGNIKNGSLYNWDCSHLNPYFCYKWDTELIVVKENKSWEDALQYCRTHHTDLASLPTDLHLIQAKQTIAMTSSVWTGLRFMAGSWFWLSGANLRNILRVQLPVCPANNFYCVSLNLENESWENRDCMEELNFVCYQRGGL